MLMKTLTEMSGAVMRIGLLCIVSVLLFTAPVTAEDASRFEVEGLRYERLRYLDQPYDVVWVDLEKVTLELFWQDEQDVAFEHFTGLKKHLQTQGRELLFATNSGIYGKDGMPLGLHIAKGVMLQRLNRGKGGNGNFYLKPNGVFFIDDGIARMLEREAYAAAAPTPELAVQSGPMLINAGERHPRFVEGSESTHIRNGVGIVDETTIVFALSLYPVNFWDFSTFFLEEAGCSDALYLDGNLSSMYVSFADRQPRGGPFVGMIGVTRALEDDE